MPQRPGPRTGSVESFPPIVGSRPRLLILGSMPGAASLRAGQYFAHPRNAFWPIMGRLVGAGPEQPYALRTGRLSAVGIALWDVLASAVRSGSLDAGIDDATIVPNALAELLASHPSIERICFNGAKAETAFCRHVLPALAADQCPERVRLPSTSPANASFSFDAKLERWRMALRPILPAETAAPI